MPQIHTKINSYLCGKIETEIWEYRVKLKRFKAIKVGINKNV